MKVVTVATDVDHAFMRRFLVASCATLGFELEILRPREPWANLAQKRPTLLRFLSRLDPDELLVFTDAYDAMFVRGPEHVAAAHAALGGGIVFSAERNCWPLGSIGFALYGERASGRWPYLNSGGFVARAGALADVFERFPSAPVERFELLRTLRTHGYDVEQKFGWSDQYYWTLVHLAEPSLVSLDREGELFECFAPPIPDVVLPEVRRRMEELRRLGRSAPVYVEGAPELLAQITKPSRAAQLHFASPITRQIVEELDAERALPTWITQVIGGSDRIDGANVRVHDV